MGNIAALFDGIDPFEKEEVKSLFINSAISEAQLISSKAGIPPRPVTELGCRYAHKLS